MIKMETKTPVQGDPEQKKANFPLFPSAKVEERQTMEKHSLFPSASITSCPMPVPTKTDLSWLTNKSYTKDTEKELITFQQELLHYQKKLSEVPHHVEDSLQDKEEPKAGDKKREHSSSEEFSDSSREYEIKRKKKRKHKHKKKHKHDRHSDPEIRDTTTKIKIREEISKNKIFLEELGDIAQTSAYRLDRSSDQNSWTYGSLYKPHIARYKYFSPICLGSGLIKKVSLYDVKKSSKHKPWHDRYFGKDNRSFIKCVGEPFIDGGTEQGIKIENYVEIKPASQELDKTTNVRQRILDESTSAYVKGQAEASAEQDTDTEPLKGPLEKKVEEFNRKIREDPNNIELWLDFLKFQDILFSESDFGRDLSSKDLDKVKPGSQALLDKKISILDKALESNPASIELHLSKLELCSEFWEPSKINKELEQLLFVHPANIALWKYYLKFNQCRLSLFTVPRVTKLYHKCFKTLFGILEGKVQTHSVPDNLCSKILEIFISYCFFLKETGYKEKALTSVQAMLEYNIVCPSTLKSASRETKMAAFEEYWDSGCSKLGLPGAKGWKVWVQQKETSGQSLHSSENLEDLEENIIEQKMSRSDTWLKIEALREAHHWLPWRPDASKGQTEEDCEDPERLVMFDDISPVLFTLPANLHINLMNFFLHLLGVDLTKYKLTTMKLSCDKCSLLQLSLSDIADMYEVLPLKGKSKPVPEDLVPEDLGQFIIYSLQQVLAEFKGQEQTMLTLILIEFHMHKLNQGKAELSKSDKKELRKTVKNLLKEEQNRNNLIIWNAYVNVERLIGKQGEADIILETALAMHSGKDISVITEDTVGLLALYRNYCEVVLKLKSHDIVALWERQDCISKDMKQIVVQSLCCGLENRKFIKNKLEAVSSTALLKMRSKFKKLIEAAFTKISSLSNESASLNMDCLYVMELCMCYGYFEYCSNGLESSQSAYQHARNLLYKRINKGGQSTQLEIDLIRVEIRLVLYHMATVSMPLSVLRSCLDTALSQHPNEHDFLRLYVDVEKRSRIAGRLHRCFDKLTRCQTSPVPALVAVWSQLEYLERIKLADSGGTEGGMSRSGIVNKTRSWLERSLSHSNVQHCALLWRLYFILEKQYGDSSRLKGIFYRSIQQCPWMKDLYMEGIGMFEDQLQELVDLMTEKEIRVQIPVEELDILMAD